MTDAPSSWADFYLDIGIQEDLASKYVRYVARCQKSGVPPIFEDDHLAKLLGLEINAMYSMIHATKKFYREFRIKKRTGGTRLITTPYPSLLMAQKWIAKSVLGDDDFRNCVTGYRQGRSILDNARMHCRRPYLLKLDLEDFFPTISFRRVMAVFRQLGYPRNVSFSLAKLCCLDDSLPQGGAASPVLSNIVCKGMDDAFYKACRRRGLRYTRYSDDITISGKMFNPGDVRFFIEIVEKFGFKINSKKLRMLGPDDKKIVTGLDITTGVPRVTRKFRRELSRDIYFVWSSGLQSHVARRRIFDPYYLDRLEGRVNFWKSIEPENRQMSIALDRIQQVKSANL